MTHMWLIWNSSETYLQFISHSAIHLRPICNNGWPICDSSMTICNPTRDPYVIHQRSNPSCEPNPWPIRDSSKIQPILWSMCDPCKIISDQSKNHLWLICNLSCNSYVTHLQSIQWLISDLRICFTLIYNEI